MAKAKSKIIQPENPKDAVSYEILAESIVELSKAARALETSRLSRRLVLLMLQDQTKLPRQEIEYVLNALPELANTYLKGGK